MWGLILALLIAIVIAGFASLNSAPVSVNLLFWKAPEISLALVVLFSVLLGVIMAALFTAQQQIKNIQKIRELQNKIKKMESGEKAIGDLERKEEAKHEEKKEQGPPQD
ncbi:hypothetical protein AMJ44_07180 [candidate division WOR-1 bacterium DG_54_3]|uniref:Lipopolysaccharide assembly protein A domain-containing protein n=1 Tax=candidate division WOR-1 bacterium DG_54_3 TaxID=1703775 RepID=A0A0S7Y0E5_UNCSA|nr:MAG: hypothetical protein AMJ44_07180 [candidate division WOR-1 bacterium DG_54_3]